MIFILIIGLVILFTLLIGKVNLSMKFDRQVKSLFALGQNISDQSFQKSQLISLQEPVQRYLNYCLKEGQSYISYARVKHDGQFKANLNKGWMNINPSSL